MRKWLLFFLLMMSVTGLSGCWSKKELSELAIISAMGIDKNEEGKYVKTVQFVNPGNVSGGLQGGGGGQGPAVTVYTAEGDTVFEAHINSSAKVSRQLYHPHANLVVIGEELARTEGVNVLLDVFERNAEVRSTTKLIISRDMKAGDMMKMLTAIDHIPAEKVNNTLKITEKMRGENVVVSLQDFIKWSTAPGIEPILSGFRVEGNLAEANKQESVMQMDPAANLEANGIAVFKDEKLIDWYEGQTARGVVWILDRVKQAEIDLEWEGKKDAVVYQVMRQNTTIKADTKKDIPEITIRVRAEGAIREVTKPVKLDDPNVIAKIEKAAEKEIKRQLQKTVERTQKNQSDIFGFGQAIYRQDAKKWKDLQKNWNETYFPQVKVTIEVEAFVRRTGLRTNDHLSELEKKQSKGGE